MDILTTENADTNLTPPPPLGGQVDLNAAIVVLPTMRLPNFLVSAMVRACRGDIP